MDKAHFSAMKIVIRILMIHCEMGRSQELEGMVMRMMLTIMMIMTLSLLYW